MEQNLCEKKMLNHDEIDKIITSQFFYKNLNIIYGR